jgi:phosphatidylglycerol:prolipoprotein diacylglycerol transferase
MMPTLFHVPILGWPIRGYGFMMFVGFLTAIWLAARRAQKVKADPDVILNVGFIALIGGVVGSRLFFVIHYWEKIFAGQGNPILAAVDITKGGMEFYGGFLLVVVLIVAYLKFKRLSIRLYTDIMAPSLMLGLAFGRVGCFLNGCCWGGLCVDQQGEKALPWAVTFPYGSWACTQQWSMRQLTLPHELLYISDLGDVHPVLRDNLSMPIEKLLGPQKAVEDAAAALTAAREAGASQQEIDGLSKALRRAQQRFANHRAMVADLVQATGLFGPDYGAGHKPTVGELQQIAAKIRSLPVHPTQLYSVINALLLSLLLSAIFAVRKRHGILPPIMFILYAISRSVLEMLRVDNPLDSAGLTISQFISAAAIVASLLWLVLLWRMPLRSPRAVPFVPEPVGKPGAKQPAHA